MSIRTGPKSLLQPFLFRKTIEKVLKQNNFSQICPRLYSSHTWHWPDSRNVMTALRETTRQDPAHHSYRDNKTGPSSPLLQRQQERTQLTTLTETTGRSQKTTLTEEARQEPAHYSYRVNMSTRQDPANHSYRDKKTGPNKPLGPHFLV